MTNLQIVDSILKMWQGAYPDEMKSLGKKQCLVQAQALANMTRREMDTLKKGGIDEDTAWTEARYICMVPPPATADD
ncbi:hypothetical protein [uncultured Pseudodesulfovibrio sp.]|uniref:hypothetical protein n=1 Tax=uncultured Pseudodesulfovibrio sp. TaxID=2035858 RepID=UPI0029C6D041|nr:hypothetical protein [uncultured Pseudodesulfovibrio sp.]